MARRAREERRASEPSGPRPDWRPLIAFAPDDVPDFMWMFRVELEDGTTVEAYKHRWTRQYLHLDSSGRAYEFRGGMLYEEANPQALLASVLERDGSHGIIVRQNDWVDGRRISWASSATRHRVSRAQTLSAIQCGGVCFPAGTARKGRPRLYFFGDDEEERPLEVVAIEQEDGRLFVIHSMPLRDRFEEKYTEALKWRR